jgi:hypothetical protein
MPNSKSKKIAEYERVCILIGTHQLLADADDVNRLGDNADTIKKCTGTLTDASKEVGLEINVEKTKYMLLSHDRNARQNRHIKIANRSFNSGGN